MNTFFSCRTMSNSFIRNQVFKDNNGDINIEIEAEIYYEDREMYFLTHQMGPRWRYESTGFTRGDEHDIKWIRRIEAYADKILNSMGLSRRSNVTFFTFTTRFVPQWGPPLPPGPGYAQRLARGGRREFSIEIITDKTDRFTRNRLPF